VKTCPHCNEVFQTDTRFCPRDGCTLVDSETSGVAVGSVVAGRYEIIREIGQGGMGVVYLATHIKMERPCALKVLRSDLLVGSETLARFHREARSASRITHPNVVAVHDFGEADDRTTYLAMEFVDGQSLDALLQQEGTLTPRRMARIVWQIANGLNVAHELSIVHRDLKPANIMLTTYRGWSDFVKVVDFGIAKAFGTTTTTTVTTTGQAVGTPLYMSPEQWAGPEVDHRSDIYSLAMIAVRSMTKDVPAIRSIALTSGNQLLDMIAEAGDWPAQVRQVLARGLEPDPEQRYGSATRFARELVEAVTRWEPPTPGVREPWEERLKSDPTGLNQASATGHRSQRIAKMPGSKRAWITLGALGVVAALAAIAWSGLWRGDVTAPRPEMSSPPAARPGDSLNGAPDQPLTPQVAGRDAARPQQPAPPPPATAVPPQSRASSVALGDSLLVLRTAFDLDNPSAEAAGRVVRVARELLALELPDSLRIEAAYRLAEAQLFLGDTAPGCTVLREIRSLAEQRGFYARSIVALIDRHCLDDPEIAVSPALRPGAVWRSQRLSSLLRLSVSTILTPM